MGHGGQRSWVHTNGLRRAAQLTLTDDALVGCTVGWYVQDGRTPLSIARSKDNKEVVRLLVAHAAELSSATLRNAAASSATVAAQPLEEEEASSEVYLQEPLGRACERSKAVSRLTAPVYEVHRVMVGGCGSVVWADVHSCAH